MFAALLTVLATTTTVLVETDPATFALEGFASHVRVSPAFAPAWTLGAGIYGLKMPSLLVDMNEANRGEGWTQTLRTGYGLFADYHLSGAPNGAFLGLQLAIQRHEVTRAGAQGRADHLAGLAMARVGYLWSPWDDLGLYVMPWLGVGTTRKLAGDTLVDGERFDVAPLVTFATVHLGWRL